MMSHSPVKPEAFRNSRNLSLARLSELGAPFLKLAARVSSRRNPGLPSSWRRGVLIGADHIGDVLYNTASLPILAESFPQCEWHFVAAPPAGEILANSPFLKSCVPSLESLGPLDVALCYNSGGYWRELVAAVQRGIPNRVGYIHKGFSGLVTHPVQIDFPQPFPGYFRSFVAQLTGNAPSWSLRPRVFPSPQDGEKADQHWRELEFDAERPVVACFVTSRQTRGVWPAAEFAAAVQKIEKASPIQTILLGAGEDLPLLRQLKTNFDLAARLSAGRLSLLPLIRFLEKCSAVLCTDSGPRHLANAAGIPPVYIRNISFSQVEAGRYCETEVDLAPDVEFVSLEDEAGVFSRIDPLAVVERVLEVVRRGHRGEKLLNPP
ncbi:MAG: glycosyltransferase family 9 protein [Blastocatellia bacterium]|nr:glycosyltransferase family 9 protein [Blastocatellia bacterium]